jgi:hypothetical protein
MKKEIVKISGELILVELVFVLGLKILFSLIPHQEYEIIYLVNINLYFTITYLIWRTINLSRVNRDILIIFGIWPTFTTISSIFCIFSLANFSELYNYLNFHFISIITTAYQLFFTFYIFIISILPHKKRSTVLLTALTFALVICSGIFAPIFISGRFMESYDPLFSRNYYMHILNFCLLIVFWHQYTQSKLIFSEYISSIISAYTILMGLQIFHMFSAENDLIFYYFGQYFNAVLYLIIIFALFSRWIYLLDPNSKENERYIENYYLLKGFIDKPRRSYILGFYSSFKTRHLIISAIIIVSLGVYLFFFNKFEIFIRLNVLILFLSVIISVILAILTLYNRWYSSIGFFFHQGEK